MLKQKVIFLDRDGVINFDSREYIKSWSEYRFLPGTLKALADLTAAGYTLILITNQSIIGRGMVSRKVLTDIHSRMRQAVQVAGGQIFDLFYCPHHPDENCDCRKPRPGMILQAEVRHHIDLSSAVMIGDSAKDIECGLNAGCGATILVRTGNGIEAEKVLTERNIFPTAVVRDLTEAARIILSGRLFTTK